MAKEEVKATEKATKTKLEEDMEKDAKATKKETKKTTEKKESTPKEPKSKKEVPETTSKITSDEGIATYTDKVVKTKTPTKAVAEEVEEERKTVKSNVKLEKKKKVNPNNPFSSITVELPDDLQVKAYKPKAKSFARQHKRAVITLDGSTSRRKQDLTPLEKAKLNLLSSFKTGDPLTGEMMGLERRDKGSTPQYVVVVKYGPYKIDIPAIMFHELTETQKQNEGAYLSSRIGSKVSFVPVSIDEVEPVAIGNRLVAMENLRKMWWFGKVKGEDTYRYREGIISEANVTAVADKFIIIEMFGVETRVTVQQLSYNYMDSAKFMYKPGNVVMAKIKKINRNQRTHEVDVEVSVKETKPNPRQQAFYLYQVGGFYKGQITGWSMSQSQSGVTQKGTRGVYVALSDDMDCLCPIPDNLDSLSMRLGDFVTIRITRAKEEKLQLDGKILHIEQSY